jgi:Threonine aldolase
MVRFDCDYSEGAHPKVLEKLMQSNMEQTVGYGEDPYCGKAIRMIREKCGRGDLDVHFFVGGTQTNLTVISAALRPHQGVLTASTGHINVHESGAIEATGHKVLALPAVDGRLTAAQIQAACDGHFQDSSREHMVQPKLVYISNATETGTIYRRSDLTAISEVCHKNGLLLYMDGARLGSALCAEDNDLDLPTIARLCDAFCIGGTKNGLLFGEALVLCDDRLKVDFRYILKQKGAMLAKGRLLGLQFIALFEDNLYFEMAAHANSMADRIKTACIRKGYSLFTESTTNQQFPILPNDAIEKLSGNYAFSLWERIDDQHSAIRICTSWATNEQDVSKLLSDIELL